MFSPWKMKGEIQICRKDGNKDLYISRLTFFMHILQIDLEIDCKKDLTNERKRIRKVIVAVENVIGKHGRNYERRIFTKHRVFFVKISL